MTFRAYFIGLAAAARADYAERVGSTVSYLLQVAYGNKRVELGLADVLVAAAGGALSLADVPMTDRAIDQHRRRQIMPALPLHAPATTPSHLEGERRAA